MNRAQFGFPNTIVGSSTFGDITLQANLPRNVQVALKLFLLSQRFRAKDNLVAYRAGPA
jgi:hypothetical protein